MSGGKFNYNQQRILEIIDVIEEEVNNNGKKIPDEELKDRPKSWYEQYPEDLYHREYPEQVIQEFKNGIKALKTAYIYAQRIDWLLCDDDGEDTFLSRLKEQLTNG